MMAQPRRERAVQDVFFRRAAVYSPVLSDDSIDGNAFNMLRQDTIIESFGQSMSEATVQGVATVENLKKYGYESELGFDEPIT